MEFTLFSIFIFLTQLGTGFQQGCFDISYDSSTCRTCHYDYYFNSSFDWNSVSFPPADCVKKQNTLEDILYVDSSSDCSQGNLCNGTLSFPFNDLFTALETIMVNSMPYINSSIHIYLYGSMSHTLYSNEVSNQGFFIFRRLDMEVVIETLLCSEINITGCYNDSSLAEILIKRNDIFFFISNQITFKNLRFNGIDTLAYTETNDTSFKESNKNIAFCSEADFLNFNSQKSICYLQNNDTLFLDNMMYGLFNLEILYDNPRFATPQLIIQNCEFIYLNFIQESSYFMQSLISVLQGSPISISFENTNISKFLSMKGILNLNQNPDSFYVYISIPNILKSSNPGFFNLSIINVSITEYNNFQLSITSNETIDDFMSIFSLHNNQTSNLLSSFPLLNVFLLNNTFSQMINLNNFGEIAFYFIRISGFNNNSNFSTINSDFSNNS